MGRWSARLAPLFLTGCFLFNSAGDDAGPDATLGPDAATDAGWGWRDGAPPPDGDVECLSFGATRLCGEACPLPCPRGSVCKHPDAAQLCVEQVTDDPRGVERCGLSAAEYGGGHFCYTGRLCAGAEYMAGSPAYLGATCVDERYCAWVRDHDPRVRCHYSQGQPYVEGPPDVPCGTGALPESGFCGGQCGDTCAPDPVSSLTYVPACAGISENRGFGVCAPQRFGCARSSPQMVLEECSIRVGLLIPGSVPCACMLLSEPLAEEWPDAGWAVAEQTCLAYQRHFPTQVRCVDETWTDL